MKKFKKHLLLHNELEPRIEIKINGAGDSTLIAAIKAPIVIALFVLFLKHSARTFLSLMKNFSSSFIYPIIRWNLDRKLVGFIVIITVGVQL